MRYLRESHYIPGEQTPTTIVVAETDLRVSLEEAADSMPAEANQFFAVFDIFEADEMPIPHAVHVAMRRQSARAIEEYNMAIAFYWWTNSLGKVTDRGTVASTRPAPFGPADMKYVMERIAKHPDYAHQTIVGICDDGTMVTLEDGRVKGA